MLKPKFVDKALMRALPILLFFSSFLLTGYTLRAATQTPLTVIDCADYFEIMGQSFHDRQIRQIEPGYKDPQKIPPEDTAQAIFVRALAQAKRAKRDLNAAGIISTFLQSARMENFLRSKITDAQAREIKSLAETEASKGKPVKDGFKPELSLDAQNLVLAALAMRDQTGSPTQVEFDHLLLASLASKSQTGKALAQLLPDLATLTGIKSAPDRIESAPITMDLVELARANSGYGTLFGREAEVTRIEEELRTIEKAGVVLKGPTGAGKTVMVEHLARKLADGTIHPSLRGKKLIRVDLESLVDEADPKIADGIMTEISSDPDTILFIENMHLLGQQEAVAQISPALRRFKRILSKKMTEKRIKIVATTSDDAGDFHALSKRGFLNKLTVLEVGNTAKKESLEIYRVFAQRLQAAHGIEVSKEAIEVAHVYTEQRIKKGVQPEKGISTLDLAASILIQKMPDPIYDKFKTMRKLEAQASVHEAKGEAAPAKAIREGELKTLKTELASHLVLTPEHVAQAVEKISGTKISRYEADAGARLEHVLATMKRDVQGQDEAIDVVYDTLLRTAADVNEANPSVDPNIVSERPIGSFLFLGKTGVGKTQLAKALSLGLFGDKDALIRINMSEYMESISATRLIGAPPGYVGYEEGGQLTEAVRRKPYSVVLFDELERAHPDVIKIFLQILDDGQVVDGQGRKVDFSNTLIIATSNLGADFIEPGAAREKYIGDLMEHVRDRLTPEIVGRFDEPVVFNALDDGRLKLIGDARLAKVIDFYRVKTGYEIHLSPTVAIELLKNAQAQEAGARGLNREIKKVLSKLAPKVLSNKGKMPENPHLMLDYRDGQYHLDEMAAPPTGN